MSTTKTLDEQLNQKADQEFDKIVGEITKNLYNPKELFRLHESKHFPVNTGQWSFYDLGQFARKAFEVYREDYREKFKAEFIYKVGAMQKEMESYIDALQPQEEQQ